MLPAAASLHDPIGKHPTRVPVFHIILKESALKDHSFTTVFQVDQSPMAVFDAINRPREWWGRQVDGATDRLGEEWTYRYQDMHFSRQKITEFVPGKRIVWHVIDAELNYVSDKGEWKGTDLIFDIMTKGDKTEVRFTHAGLVPEVECFDSCTSSWSGLIQDSLKGLIATGQGRPDVV